MNALRPLSGLERVWLAADRLCPPFVNQIVVEGQGVLAAPSLARAVERSAGANPGVAVRLVGWLDRARWVAGPAPRLVEVDGGAWDGRGPVGAPFLLRPLAPVGGPVAEVLLAAGQPCRLVVRTHHAVCDGGGTARFAEDLFRVLRGESPLGSEGGPHTDLDLAPDVPIRRFAADRVAPTGSPTSETLAVTWTRRSVAAPPGNLLARCAVALWAASRAWTTGPLRLAVSVDLRRHRPGLSSTANLSGFFHLDLPPEPDPVAVRQAVRDALASGREGEPVREAWRYRGAPLWLMSAVGSGAARRLLRTGRAVASASLSNLGRVDLDRLSAPGFAACRAFWIPPGNPGNPLFLTLTGAGGVVELCAAAPVGLASDGRLEALSDAVARGLAG